MLKTTHFEQEYSTKEKKHENLYKKISVIPLTFSFLLCILQYSQITANAARVYYATDSYSTIHVDKSGDTTALFQISAKMFIGNSPSGVAISDWSANININNNSITIQGNDGNSQVSITKKTMQFICQCLILLYIRILQI